MLDDWPLWPPADDGAPVLLWLVDEAPPPVLLCPADWALLMAELSFLSSYLIDLTKTTIIIFLILVMKINAIRRYETLGRNCGNKLI